MHAYRPIHTHLHTRDLPERVGEVEAAVDGNGGQRQDGANHERDGDEGGQSAQQLRQRPGQRRRGDDPYG